MNIIVSILMLFHLFVTICWIANSAFLFSVWGLTVWVLSILLGFIAYKRINEHNIARKPLLYSTAFMAFLLLLTGWIHLTVSSMP
ncbi:hypothetical protein ACFOGI_11355 [Virgibacillus xinjiangensis]|uniref:Uncharacterized protein n=1 Tax=Virgibacillus xinjiangensis TaxID=393090 RepID=A0ABV7CXV0_9BACI